MHRVTHHARGARALREYRLHNSGGEHEVDPGSPACLLPCASVLQKLEYGDEAGVLTGVLSPDRQRTVLRSVTGPTRPTTIPRKDSSHMCAIRHAVEERCRAPKKKPSYTCHSTEQWRCRFLTVNRLLTYAKQDKLCNPLDPPESARATKKVMSLGGVHSRSNGGRVDCAYHP